MTAYATSASISTWCPKRLPMAGDCEAAPDASSSDYPSPVALDRWAYWLCVRSAWLVPDSDGGVASWASQGKRRYP